MKNVLKLWLSDNILQKLFLVGLAIIAAVSADVSHLNHGYNYPQPNPTFNDGSDQLSLPIAPPQPPQPPQPSQPQSTQQYLPPQHGNS